MATKYWIGGGGSWTDTAHWSTTSGGSGGTAAAGSADTAVFDSSSGTGTITLPSAQTITAVSIQGCSALTVTGNYTFTTSGVSTFNNGTFTFNNLSTALAGLTVPATSTSGDLTFATVNGNAGLGAITFTSGGANVTVADNYNTNGTFSASTILVNGSAGTLDISSRGTGTVSGLITVSSTGSSLYFGGLGAKTFTTGITVTSSTTAGSLTFNCTGVVTLGAVTFSPTSGMNMTLNNPSNVAVTSILANSFSQYIIFSNTGTVVISGTVTATDGNITFGGLGTVSSVSIGALTLNGWSLVDFYNSTTVTITTFTISNTASNGGASFNNGTTCSLGTVVYNSIGAIINVANTGNVTMTSLTANTSAGSLNFTNTGTITVGAVSITNTGADIYFANGTNVTLSSTFTINTGSSSGSVEFSNSGTLGVTGAISITSSGTSINFINGSNTTFSSSLTITIGSSSGVVQINNTGTLTVSSINYQATSSPGTQLYFGTTPPYGYSNLTTVTVNGVSGLSISGLYENVSFTCTTLALTGTTNIKAGPAFMTCNVTITNGPWTLTSDLTTSGALSWTNASGNGLLLGGYVITASSANINGPVSWDTNSRSSIALNYNVSLSNYTILTTGTNFAKTLLADYSGGYNPAYFTINLFQIDYLSNYVDISTSSTGDYPSLYFVSDYGVGGELPYSINVQNIGAATLYLDKILFKNYSGNFYVSDIYITGDVTFSPDMNFNATAVHFTGNTTFNTRGNNNITYWPVYLEAVGGSLTLSENLYINDVFYVTNGTLNLRDHIVVCDRLRLYNGSSVSIVAIVIDAGSNQTGSIVIRKLGANGTATASILGPYTGAGSTYTLLNNPTIIMEPYYGNFLSNSGQIYNYQTTPLANIILKPALDGVAWNLNTGGTFAANDFIIYDTFGGTIDTAVDYYIYGDTYIGNTTSFTNSTTSALYLSPTAGTTNTLQINGTMPRPIVVNAADSTGTVRLASNVSINKTLALTTGKLDLNDYTLTALSTDGSAATSVILAFGTSGKLVVNGTGTVWNVTTTITYTGTSRVEINNATSTAASVDAGATAEADTLNFYVKAGTYSLTLIGSVNTIDFTGFSGTLAAGARTIYGSWVASANMTITGTATAMTFAGTSGTKTITSNGKAFNMPLTFNGAGSTWQFQDAATDVYLITLTNGTIDLNGKTLTFQQLVTATGTKNITFNGGTLTLTGTGGMQNTVPTGFTTTAGAGGSGFITMTYSGTKTFVGGGSAYAATLVQAATGQITISGNNTFTNMKNTVVPANIAITSNTTQTLTSNFQLKGTASALATVTAITSGTAANLSLASGTVTCDYLSLKDNKAIGGAAWYAGNHSSNVSNTSGWTFTASPTSNPQMMMVFPL